MKGDGRNGGGMPEVQIGTLVSKVNGQVDITWQSGSNLPVATGSSAHAYINGKVRWRIIYAPEAHQSSGNDTHLSYSCRIQ